MQLVTDVVEYGDVADIHVTGIASVNKVSEHMIRVTYYTSKPTSSDPDVVEKRVTVHLVWDMANWLLSQAGVQTAMSEFLTEIINRGREGVPH